MALQTRKKAAVAPLLVSTMLEPGAGVGDHMVVICRWKDTHRLHVRAMAWLIASACLCCLQVPGGERVPFLFTIKELQAKGNLAKFGGSFKVPSYRGSSFLDPKVELSGTTMMAASDMRAGVYLQPWRSRLQSTSVTKFLPWGQA